MESKVDNNFIDLVLHPVGNSYQTTNYDRMTEELGQEMAVVPPVRQRGNPDDKLARDDVLYFSI